MVKRSVCFILTFVMIVCSLLTDNSVYAASKLTTLKVDKVYKQFDLDHDGKMKNYCLRSTKSQNGKRICVII